MFFDTVILESRLPVFNYGDTYDGNIGFDIRSLGALNRDESVLFDVDVGFALRSQAKQEAFAELQKVHDGRHTIAQPMAKDILDELPAAEYRWSPSLGDLDQTLGTQQEKDLAKFLLGGLIFAAYAQVLNGQHIVQPKRSRLLLAVALGANRATYAAEEELFGELKKRARSSVTDLPWRPTFFPYLLATCNTPEEIIARTLVLRHSPEVAEFRVWLKEAFQEWETHGHLASKQKDLRAITKTIDRSISIVGVAPTIEMKVSVANVLTGTPPGAVDLMPPLEALWGWSFSNLPGRRYRKLLVRAVAADHQYVKIENRLRTVWGTGHPAQT